MTLKATRNRSAGYALLIERYQLNVLPNRHTSAVSTTGTLRSTTRSGGSNPSTPRLIGTETGREITWSLPLSTTVPTLGIAYLLVTRSSCFLSAAVSFWLNWTGAAKALKKASES